MQNNKLPQIPQATLDYLQTLPKKCSTKDNSIPLGVLFCDTAEEAVKYPILHFTSYYKDIIDETLKVLPNSIVVNYTKVFKDEIVLIDYSPLNNHIEKSHTETKTSYRVESNEKYVKRILEWCVINKYNIILRTIHSIYHTEIQVF